MSAELRSASSVALPASPPGAKRTRTGQQLNQGGIIDIETFVDISNIQLVCGNCHKLTRPGHRVNDEGTKERFCRKCEAVL